MLRHVCVLCPRKGWGGGGGGVGDGLQAIVIEESVIVPNALSAE